MRLGAHRIKHLVELDHPAIGVGAEELMPALDRPLAHVAVGDALGVEARPHRRDVVHAKGEVSGAERVYRQPVTRGEAGVIRDEVVLVAPGSCNVAIAAP